MPLPTVPLSATYGNVQTARVAAILPAAGAYDATPIEMPCSYFAYVTFYITYTPAQANGAVDFMIEVSPRSADAAGVEDWFQASIVAGGAVAPGADTTSLIQREEDSYTAVAVAAESFTYGPVELCGTVERIRISCQESGVVGNPGDCHIVAVFA